MKRTLEQFKDDIIVACDRVAEHIKGYSFETFAKDSKTFDAVMMELIIIGEASAQFPDETREQNSEIRWKSIVGLRNFMTHEYFEIDPKRIWSAATIYAPELKKQIENLQLA